ncbi:MAG TPA: PPC domain-containing DNA-binding protein [Candidatus Saccharimonadales bacterium]|nr:PPC domain-containing DNA-binding protein [Candidatus Saccharimonadales bacterium]
MGYKFDGYNWFGVVKRGEELVTNLTEFANKEKVKGAWIFIVGACDEVELGYYDLKSKSYKFKKYEQELEILNVQGNISWNDDKPAIHLHGTFAGEDGKAFGGHVKSLKVSVTCEIFIHDWFGSDKIERKPDDSVGLKLLDL